MSGKRPLFRSPKFAEGMTSEAIEVSGVKLCIFAIGRGNGVARRFESMGTNEPSDISLLKPGKTAAINFFQTEHRHYSPGMRCAQSNVGLGLSILAECVRKASP
ncbi:MAG: hypothetical protein WA806_16775, partial [Bradyrhizobium sp.]